MNDRDRDNMIANLRRFLEPFGVEVDEVDVCASEEVIKIRVETLKDGCRHESTSWFDSPYRIRWAEDIGQTHLIGHYRKDIPK